MRDIVRGVCHTEWTIHHEGGMHRVGARLGLTKNKKVKGRVL
jgi:hypothetical protein